MGQIRRSRSRSSRKCTVPSWDYILKKYNPNRSTTPVRGYFFSMKGLPIPQEIIDKANEELETLINILKT